MEQEPQTARDDRLTLEHTADRYERYLNAVVPPIFMNSLHLYPTFETYDSVDTEQDDQFLYGRVSNPTTAVLEKKLAELEHGNRAAAFSSGMKSLIGRRSSRSTTTAACSRPCITMSTCATA